jgi:hypothetical protein
MRTTAYSILFLLILWLSAVPAGAEPVAQPAKGEILGHVTDAATGEPLVGVTVSLIDKYGGTITDTSGTYRLTGLSPGDYALRYSHVGYETGEITGIAVAAGQSSRSDATLEPRVVTIKGITVTPGRFQIMGDEPTVHQTLTRSEIETIPQLGDDFFRAVNRLPGVSGNDLSTRFTVRGGEYEEVLVSLDGLQVYEPFHLKDIDGGAMSIVDVAAVERIDLMTGGFPALYGDRMSGVFNISSRQPPRDSKRLNLSLSMLNTRLLSEGTFGHNRGSWLVSLRRGYIDLVFKLVGADENVKPTYYDLFGKFRYQLNGRHFLGFNFLHAGDDLRYRGEDDEVGDTLETSYGNSYAWLTLWSQLHNKVTVRTIASVGQVKHDRRGRFYDSDPPVNGPTLKAHDKKDFQLAGLASDWEWELGQASLLQFGVDARRLAADYDYFSQVFVYAYRETPDSSYVELDRIDTTQAWLDPSGYRVGLYLSSRTSIADPLVAELGVRYDRAGYIDKDHVSPRVSFLYEFGGRTSVRAGWGHYWQMQGIDDIPAGDGENEFHRPEKAEQWVVGLQHDFESGVLLRAEAYYKKYHDLRPDYRNSFDDIEAFPELEQDRIVVHRENSVSRGIELFLKKDAGGKLSWWASYAYALCEDSVTAIGFLPEDVEAAYDRKLPTPNDQRHTLYFDLSYRPNYHWQFNLAFQYHTGWPYTGVHIATVPLPGGGTRIYLQSDEQLSSRHSSYRRLDLRFNRYFRVGNGRITAFVELINVFGFDNVRSYSYHLRSNADGGYYLDAEPEHWFGRLPSFGVAYEVSF